MTCGPGDTLVLGNDGMWFCEHSANLHFWLYILVAAGLLFGLWMMLKKKAKHREPSIKELLHRLILLTAENKELLEHIRICVCRKPHLSHFEVKLMDLTITVGQTTVATVTNAMGSDGLPFSVDPSTIVWSLGDPSLANQNPQADGSNPVTGVAAGTEVVTATVGSVSNFGTLTIAALPPPTLASFDVSFAPATP